MATQTAYSVSLWRGCGPKPLDMMRMGRWKRGLVFMAVILGIIFILNYDEVEKGQASIMLVRNKDMIKKGLAALTKQDNSGKGGTLRDDTGTRERVRKEEALIKPKHVQLPVVYTDLDFKKFKPDSTLKIPRIIHQTWKSHRVPTHTKEWIRSWRTKNPNWEYWFWTDKDAETLIRKKYPQYLKYYNLYEKAIQKADIMRYFVLHYFGGFYADIDIAAVKSLDPLTTSHYAIVSQEPFAHSKVFWGWDRKMQCNALMASAKGHAYMGMILETIPRNFYGNKRSDVMNKTGPMMIGRILNDYRDAKKRNYSISDTVYVADPDVFHPNFDTNIRFRFMEACKTPRKFRFTEPELKRCEEERKRNFNRFVPEVAYTDHHWMHHWVGGVHLSRIRPDITTHVQKIIADMKNVTDILSKL